VCGTTRETSCRGVCCVRFLIKKNPYSKVRHPRQRPQKLAHQPSHSPFAWRDADTGALETQVELQLVLAVGAAAEGTGGDRR
jgi:hypothetical protein